MPEPRKCPNCGTALVAETDGLCPRCLLSGAQEGPSAESFFFSDNGDEEDAELSSRFPEYDHLVRLGVGGMGTVYRARHKKLDRAVALKFLKPSLSDDPEFSERFLREARTLAQLDHPNIVRVHDFGERDGQCFLSMEYVDGTNLRSVLMNQGLSSPQTLRIIPQICDALQYAHGEGVVHRDIKPENILIDRLGGVKIADFGLAKLTAPGEPHLTETSQTMGTPHYMAPEQVEHSRDVDHRADIFSLGVVFYEMLTGELPIGAFEPPSKAGDTPAALDGVVMRSLEKDPGQRYQRASEIGADVEAIREGRRSHSRGPGLLSRWRSVALILATVVTTGWVIFMVTKQGDHAPGDQGTERTADRQAILAAGRGDLAGLRRALDAGADPNAYVAREESADVNRPESALGRAIAARNLEAVKLLLEHGASPNIADADGGNQALHIAARLGFEEIVDDLAAAGAELDPRDPGGWTPLLHAVAAGHSKVVAALLRIADSRREKAGRFPIDLEIVDAKTRNRPLHFACEKRSAEMVRLLLNAGADPNSIGMGSLVPAHTVALRCDLDLHELFVAKGGVDPKGYSLISAYSKKRRALVKKMVEAGVSVDSAPFGWTMVTAAAQYDDISWVRFLLELGADPTQDGLKEAAEKRGKKDIIALIEERAEAHRDGSKR